MYTSHEQMECSEFVAKLGKNLIDKKTLDRWINVHVVSDDPGSIFACTRTDLVEAWPAGVGIFEKAQSKDMYQKAVKCWKGLKRQSFCATHAGFVKQALLDEQDRDQRGAVIDDVEDEDKNSERKTVRVALKRGREEEEEAGPSV
jgi:hypothetical protein